MTDNCCVCPQCLHPTCPPPHAEPPYDEVAHQVDENLLSVKIPKSRGKFEEGQEKQEKRSFDFNCADSEGEKCKPGCTKVHVTPDQHPPVKKPDEEMLSLKTTRHIMPNDDLKSMLEIEFKAPRNYIPLPEPGPTPPIIVPKQRFRKKRKGKRTK
ncbi:PREDICTED: uncharacterized protein LOC108577742 [Habropoda laboriosa]|uniref:uncharacterized protein LOC108577742 n=1 Tax=Habropoda laboriosa TaxID=597456 RepID=UPI00083D2430|nr:PREDICTED: uncharacterized protein LOC108577742 [Habropoda laboriosa]